MLVFVMHTKDENCCINNSHYPVVHIAAATPLGKVKKGTAIDDHDKKSDSNFYTSYALHSTMHEERELPSAYLSSKNHI